jgi:hypothetical protein
MQDNNITKEQEEKLAKKKEAKEKREKFIKEYKRYIVVGACYVAFIAIILVLIIASMATGPKRIKDGRGWIKYYYDGKSGDEVVVWVDEGTNQCSFEYGSSDGNKETIYYYTLEKKKSLTVYTDEAKTDFYAFFTIGRLYDLTPIAYKYFTEELSDVLGFKYNANHQFHAIDDYVSEDYVTDTITLSGGLDEEVPITVEVDGNDYIVETQNLSASESSITNEQYEFQEGESGVQYSMLRNENGLHSAFEYQDYKNYNDIITGSKSGTGDEYFYNVCGSYLVLYSANKIDKSETIIDYDDYGREITTTVNCFYLTDVTFYKAFKLLNVTTNYDIEVVEFVKNASTVE